MIKLVDRVTASALWEIEGQKISLQYRRDISEAEIISRILAYKQILQNEAYRCNNDCLCQMFRFFGGIAFVKIGMVYEKQFLDCYSFFAARFAEQWADGKRCLGSKNIGYFYVFGCMLDCPPDPIRYDFRYILDEIPESPMFCDLTEQAFAEYWTPKLETLMAKNKSLFPVSKRVGAVRVSRYMMRIPELTKRYMGNVAGIYTAERELVSLRKLYNFVFGDDSRSNFNGGDQKLFKLLQMVTEEEAIVQNRRFVAENRASMDISSDQWVLYERHGVNLHYMRLDFTEIRQASMRTEVKYFLKNRFFGSVRTDDRIYPAIVYAVNTLCRNNPRLHFFADIDETDVKMLQLTMESEDKKTQAFIMDIFYVCKAVFRYLCGGERDDALPVPKPYSDPFQKISFVNSSKYSRNTPYIPETVVKEMTTHLDELSETDALVLKIFNETGMRAKEVAFLKEDCLIKTRTGKHALLKFVPYKVLKARRKAGLGDCHQVQISLELAGMIAGQAKRTEEFRRRYALPYIFLHQNKGYKVSMLDVSYFSAKVNNLIRRHNICDESGQPWHFTSRQCRKTLVVNMIENGAAVEEIVYQLGHLDRSTAGKYYAEVRTIRLAELNSDFFKKQFDLLLSGEQLAEYTEEERRLLYVDFRLGYRRVEMGFCTKKLSGGACGNESRMHHCASCKNLCTGKFYLSHWESLVLSQENRVGCLTEAYAAEGIMDYSEFAEYRRECALLAAYCAVTEKIRKGGVSGR